MNEKVNKINKVLLVLVIILAFTTLYLAFNKNAEAPTQTFDQNEIKNITTPIAPDTTSVTPIKKTPEVVVPLSECLPAGIKLTTPIEDKANVPQSTDAWQYVTVEDALKEVSAQCTSSSKLIDKTGKEITFYRMNTCWGVPPPNSQEIQQQQTYAINKLKEKYTVIIINCGLGPYKPA